MKEYEDIFQTQNNDINNDILVNNNVENSNIGETTGIDNEMINTNIVFQDYSGINGVEQNDMISNLDYTNAQNSVVENNVLFNQNEIVSNSDYTNAQNSVVENNVLFNQNEIVSNPDYTNAQNSIVENNVLFNQNEIVSNPDYTNAQNSVVENNVLFNQNEIVSNPDYTNNQNSVLENNLGNIDSSVEQYSNSNSEGNVQNINNIEVEATEKEDSNYNPMEHPDAKIVLNKNVEEKQEHDPEIENIKIFDELKSNRSLIYVLSIGLLLFVITLLIPRISEFIK